MSTRFLSLSLPLVILFMVMVSSCASFKEPEYRAVENIRVGKFGFNRSTLHFDIHYFNPNKSSLKLNKAKGDVWIEDNYLGKFSIDTLIRIPANGAFRLPAKLEIDMKKIVENSLVSFLSREVTIRVEGKAKVGKGFIYISYPLKYTGKHRLSELLK